MLAPMFRATAAATVLAVLLSGCGSAGQPAPYDSTGIDELHIPTPSPQPADFAGVVDNPWLSWQPGEKQVLAVTAAGRPVGQFTVSVARTPEEMSGISVLAVTETLELDDEEARESVGWFAQDRRGHVWWLAGESGGARWSTEGGDAAGLLLPASPRVGDGWVAVEDPDARQTVRVEELTDLETEAGSWDDVIAVTIEGATTQRRYYARGVGLVRIVDVSTGLVMERDGAPAD
jgi:hypothetical protein